MCQDISLKPYGGKRKIWQTNKQTNQTNTKNTKNNNNNNKTPFNKLQLMKLTPSWEFAAKSLFSCYFTNHNSVFAFCECVLHAVIILCPLILRNIINPVREINTCIFHVHECRKKWYNSWHCTVAFSLLLFNYCYEESFWETKTIMLLLLPNNAAQRISAIYKLLRMFSSGWKAKSLWGWKEVLVTEQVSILHCIPQGLEKWQKAT